MLYARGIPIGGKEKDTGNYFVYNHAKLTVQYHEDPAYEGARVVGFEVQPLSVQQDAAVDPKCDKEHAQKSVGMPVDELPHMIIKGSTLKDGDLPKVLYSYDVFWVPSNIQWASRWDIYLSMGDLYSSKVRAGRVTSGGGCLGACNAAPAPPIPGPLVLHHQLADHLGVLDWHGRHDLGPRPPRGHCALQPRPV